MKQLNYFFDWVLFWVAVFLYFIGKLIFPKKLNDYFEVKRKAEVKEMNKKLLLELYTFEEILEIMGYYDGIGSTAWDDETQIKLELLDSNFGMSKEFEEIVMNEAVINGNFEEPLKLGARTAI